MKVKVIISLFCAALLVLMSGCGQTFDLQSVEITPTSASMVGIGATQRVNVVAHYTNNKSNDVTSTATYTLTADPAAPLAPAGAVTINANGLISVLGGACTWTATTNATTNVTTYATSPYVLTASFGGQQVKMFVSVASVAGCKSPATPNG